MSQKPVSQNLFAETTAGALELTNRVVMAPLTRNRADDSTGEVLDRHAEYYAQRASAGLIITEGSQISAEAKGYIQTPGIHTAAQAVAWRKVTDAVHAKGGKIVIQLWHVGRITHRDARGADGCRHPARDRRLRSGREIRQRGGI